MKILHTADWHLGPQKGPVQDGVNLRYQDTVGCLFYMLDVARREKPELVCISGDIFHQEQVGPNRFSDEALTAAGIIEELSKCANTVIVMRGTPNHDGSGIFAVLEGLLKHLPNVVVVTTPQVIQTKYADVACIPGFNKQDFRAKFPGLSADEENIKWTEYISNLVMALRASCEKTAILMAHYTVPGCNMESGQTSFFANFEPVIPREALQAADYDAVLLGHVHRPQELQGLKEVYYAGAINAMNFNDEGQERGFWIHSFGDGRLPVSDFYETPYRKFLTLKWTSEQLANYLRDGKMYLLENDLSHDVEDKIIRLQYECTPEQRKALNKPVLTADLYECGAFYVADVEAESVMEVTNQGMLSEESDPLLNLKKWLDEKCFNNTDSIVELAEPIIASAQKKASASGVHGVFRPVSIAVKNYRNYREEQFDFSDISFCTINGVNGAGKSSLFMDAIVDCLFEETREGDCKAWLRGAEDARSGSIEFIFDIGDARFRVVRTRTKSGKPTLNLSQQSEDGTEWLNLSKERTYDTQAEIERIIGMDSMTFRSCALIMQDQYGLFLQAKKEDRIAILGNLLGLGLYDVMEQDVRKCLGDAKRELTSQKEAVRVKTEFIRSKGDPAAELEEVEASIKRLTEKGAKLAEEKAHLEAEQAEYKMAAKKRDSIESEVDDTISRQAAIRLDTASVKELIASCDSILAKADTIREKAEEYRKVTDELAVLEKKRAAYEEAKSVLIDYEEQEQKYQAAITQGETRRHEIEEELKHLSAEAEAETIQSGLSELADVRIKIDDMREKKEQAAEINQEIFCKQADHDKEISELRHQLATAKSDLEAYKRQRQFMEDSGCPNIDNASCRFLQKAVSDVAKIADTEAAIRIFQQSIDERDKAFTEWRASRERDAAAVGYDIEEHERLVCRVTELSEFELKKEILDSQRVRRARLEAEMDSNDKIIASNAEHLSTVKIKAQEATERVNSLSDSVSNYQNLIEWKKSLQIYPEQEQRLPVYEERKKNAEEKLASLQAERTSVDDKLVILDSQLLEAKFKLESANKNAGDLLKETEHRIEWNNRDLTEEQVAKGTLMQKLQDVEQMQAEITALNKDIEASAALAQKYDVLKQAFSQDGVPHQIIRNIVPHITDTANSILGSMTGGTMGVEFVMERTVKGKDGDKATLDVLIDEYGKNVLPYASKSGGEKVKASLAVILALAEIKTTAAGIQLGMLFIDEPPFLDDDGTQAYVDSLEAIRKRYPDIKVMAITHDDAMKARFSQSVSVTKDETGSHVQWD
ncbi:MAG: AAA family ATPase [Lachnospiraceae bacterium]|nr:AAA family ATPase [Lachnospiraceae bacterium]